MLDKDRKTDARSLIALASSSEEDLLTRGWGVIGRTSHLDARHLLRVHELLEVVKHALAHADDSPAGTTAWEQLYEAWKAVCVPAGQRNADELALDLPELCNQPPKERRRPEEVVEPRDQPLRGMVLDPPPIAAQPAAPPPPATVPGILTGADGTVDDPSAAYDPASTLTQDDAPASVLPPNAGLPFRAPSEARPSPWGAAPPAAEPLPPASAAPPSAAPAPLSSRPPEPMRPPQIEPPAYAPVSTHAPEPMRPTQVEPPAFAASALQPPEPEPRRSMRTEPPGPKPADAEDSTALFDMARLQRKRTLSSQEIAVSNSGLPFLSVAEAPAEPAAGAVGLEPAVPFTNAHTPPPPSSAVAEAPTVDANEPSEAPSASEEALADESTVALGQGVAVFATPWDKPPPSSAHQAAAPASTAAQPDSHGQGPTSQVELTLEQYTSLCVECSLDETRIGETLARYRLRDDAARQALDQLWQQRFTQDPALYERFNQLYHQYSSWIQQQRGGADTGRTRTASAQSDHAQWQASAHAAGEGET